MRTRFYNKLNSPEVDEYLNRNNIIFIPFGSIHERGGFPLNADQTLAEAVALKMAELCDALVFGPLPFFCAGASEISPATVQMPSDVGADYLKELSYSLLNQGFRRQIYVSASPTGAITASQVVIDFFDETKCPITFMDLTCLIQVANENCPDTPIADSAALRDTMTYGAYRILNREKTLPMVCQPGSADPAGSAAGEYPDLSASKSLEQVIGFYFPEDETAPCPAEDPEAVLSEGVRLIEQLVNALDIPKYMDSLRNLDVWTNTYIKSKYAGNLPKNKFAPWQ